MPELETGDCDVCALDGYDGEPADYCTVKTRLARKTHHCSECGFPILPGEAYEYVSGKWEGDLMVVKTCALCMEIRNKFSCGEGWVYLMLWESLRENLFDRLTTGCLTGLSIPAREKILAQWRIWKGLEAA